MCGIGSAMKTLPLLMGGALPPSRPGCSSWLQPRLPSRRQSCSPNQRGCTPGSRYCHQQRPARVQGALLG